MTDPMTSPTIAPGMCRRDVLSPHRVRCGGSTLLALLLLAGVLALAALGAWWFRRSSGSGPRDASPLVLHCAAGVMQPIEEIRRLYEDELGVPVRIQYGGSGTLLSTLTVAGGDDLYLAADSSYIDTARDKGLVAESLPLARIHLVIAVRDGNPREIGGLEDLLRSDVRVGMANPDAAAVGRASRDVLTKLGLWDDLRARIEVLKPTVNDLATDVKIGTIDAAIIWDANVAQLPELRAVETPELTASQQEITVAVLSGTRRPAQALRFCRFASAPERGQPVFERWGYAPVAGDRWSPRPRLLLFSGGVNRLAIEDTLEAFEEREGVELTRVYNGCGILVSQIRGGEVPDAYFACDASFIPPVQTLFQDPVVLSETDMVIVVSEGNPERIRSVNDLVRTDLSLGFANPEQSALGALTERLLTEMGLWQTIQRNGTIAVNTPTADLLVNQVLTGALDAAIVYRANTPHARERLEIIDIDHSLARAVQPYVISLDSPHKLLMRRLLETLEAEASRARFRDTGFRWLQEAP